MFRRRLIVVAVAFASAVAGCGDGGSDEPVAGSAAVRALYQTARAKHYDGQAELLADGHVSFDELHKANLALVACAERRGVSLKLTSFQDMTGPREIAEPTNTSGAVDAQYVNGVIDACQTREQMLVDRAFAHEHTDLTDAAYALWKDCAKRHGFEGTLPRNYNATLRAVGGEAAVTCDPEVMSKLETAN